MAITTRPNFSNNFVQISKSFGLDRFEGDRLHNNNGLPQPKIENSKEFARNFFTNWFDDFHFYLNRVPGLQKEMLKHLKWKLSKLEIPMK